jgi:hypothetical protein
VSGIPELPSVIEMPTLRAAFPAYQFRTVMLGDKRRIEAILRRGATGAIFCLVGRSREIYIELMKFSSVAPSLHGQR